jgi:hypothetical protein
MAFVNIANMNFVVNTEYDAALMHTPVQFVFYQGRRVGLYMGVCIYFAQDIMEELIGREFNVTNFPQALNFFQCSLVIFFVVNRSDFHVFLLQMVDTSILLYWLWLPINLMNISPWR